MIENPFKNSDLTHAEPQQDIRRTEKHLGPVGAKLRRIVDQKHGSLRDSLSATEETPTVRSLASPEELAVLEAYRHRDTYFDEAKETYRQLTLKASSGTVLSKAAATIVRAQKESGLSADVFIEELDNDCKEHPEVDGASLALGSAYTVVGQYSDAEHCMRTIGPPSTYRHIHGWLELYDACVQNNAATQVTNLAESVADLTAVLEGMRKREYIEPEFAQAATKIIDIAKRLPSKKMTAVLQYLFEMLEEIPLYQDYGDGLRIKNTGTILQRGLLELQASRFRQAEEALTQLEGEQTTLATLHLAFARSTELSPTQRDQHLHVAKQEILTRSSDLGRIAELIDAASDNELPDILISLKKKVALRSVLGYTACLDHLILKGALRIHDQEMATWSFKDLEHLYQSGNPITSWSGDALINQITISIAYVRACALLDKPIEPTFSHLMNGVLLDDSKLAQTRTTIDASHLFELADTVIEQGQDTGPLLKRIKTLIEHGQIFIDQKGLYTIWQELLQRQTAFAAKQCQGIARKKAALSEKDR